MSSHNTTGREGEAIARKYLQEKGYRILDTNWRYDHAEIDIIATKNQIVVFIEVKTRKNELYGFPEESVGIKKQNHLHRAAEGYLEEKNLDLEIRFDIVSILVGKKPYKIYHIKDAFFPESD